MTAINQILDHRAANELLPWLLNRTLQDNEHRQVELHLAACDECAEDLSMLKKMRQAILQDDLTPLVPRPDPDLLLRSMDEAPPIAGPAMSPRWMIPAAAAAVLIAFLTMSLLQDDPKPTVQKLYETATTGPSGTEMDYVFDFRFEEYVSDEDIRHVLKDLNASEVVVDAASGEVRTAIRLSLTSLNDLDAFAKNMEKRNEIQSVTVVAVQLPVRSVP